MLEELETRAAEATEVVDPYDGVALGVECAWPPQQTPAQTPAEAQ